MRECTSRFCNRRIPDGTYGGVRGRDVERFISQLPPTRLYFRHLEFLGETKKKLEKHQEFIICSV